MSDVKRYEPFGRDGLSSVMHEDDVGDYVRHDDYEAKRKGWIEQHARDSAELRRLCGERDSLFAERRQLESELRHRQKLIDDAWHAWEVALKGCEAMRSERDSHQRLCIAEMEKNAQLRAELEAIRGQQVVGYQYQDRNGEWHGFCDQLHYQNTVEDGTWPIRAIYALPPQQPDAVSVPRELAERISVLFPLDMDDDGSGRAGFYPHVIETVRDFRALLSTKNAEEGE
ncbi:hypothetical protein [Pseudomonas sp. zfem003]|uniref:hypothetical protein n=1 Tax=Pseudomonas sp. zfem003 TaxID=3078198 RepID=UPI002927FB2C|nr:hypothetical protein [Pseudomonas sp. zfem003]MDU9398091.1 hypothetical protein [Pseudomonas sp. zfem003]